MSDSRDPSTPADDSNPLAGKRLELDYPCPWTYTVIGEEETELRTQVAVIVGDLEHTLTYSHTSRGGKYRSFQLEVVVPDERTRLTIFEELHASEHVRYVF